MFVSDYHKASCYKTLPFNPETQIAPALAQYWAWDTMESALKEITAQLG